MVRFRQSLSLCLLLLLFFPSALPAQNPPPSYARCGEINHLLHWPRFPVHVYFTPTALSTPERRNEAQTGFDEWVHATQGAVCYMVVTDEAASDLTVTLAGSVSLPKAERALGQTVLTYDGAVLTHAVIQLVDTEDDPARFQEICAHEFGHALGIDGHSDNPDDMMFPVLSHSLFQVENPELDWLCLPSTITERDVNTLQAAYPFPLFVSKKH